MSMLGQCGEGCGWVAAILAALSWGTFGVPIKTNVNVEVNFFVMQTYKTIVCFLTSWLVILLGEQVRFTPWGIVSGLFWVPGAACGIYGIRNAGLAVAVGTWSSIIVVSSFIFGIIIFEEKVKDMTQTMMAFTCLMMGLVGMSRYADPSFSNSASGSTNNTTSITASAAGGATTGSLSRSSSHDLVTGMAPSTPLPTSVIIPTPPKTSPLPNGFSVPTNKRKSKNGSSTTDDMITSPMHDERIILSPNIQNGGGGSSSLLSTNITATPTIISSTTVYPMELESNDTATVPLLSSNIDDANKKFNRKDRVVFFGGRLALTKRQLGVLGAVVNGAWGGLNLIPLHYAQRDEGLTGAGYLISYASGSLLVCIVIWIGMFVYQYHHHRGSVHDALEALPSFHFKELGVPGLCSGLLYSFGNFCSILAVAYLGQGIGYSFCQAQLLISGLWGVFYFKEIKGRDTISKWFISATVAVTGIIWLSNEHEGGGAH